jgi:phosphoglycolate phosphatase-like HAD superfamily hydrolase
MTATIAVVDVDGTLVDTNYHHSLAWFRAFDHCGVVVPVWKVHRAIGMGGDRLPAAVAGDEVERAYGDEIRAAWAEIFDPMLEEIPALAGAHKLLETLRDRGFSVVLASSGKPEHVDHYLDLLDARDLVTGWTTAEDVEDTKPAPDLIGVALTKGRGERAMAIGDSVWDCRAAAKLDIPTTAVLTGGFGKEELTEAGASRVYEDLLSLMKDLDNLPAEEPAD